MGVRTHVARSFDRSLFPLTPFDALTTHVAIAVKCIADSDSSEPGTTDWSSGNGRQFPCNSVQSKLHRLPFQSFLIKWISAGATLSQSSSLAHFPLCDSSIYLNLIHSKINKENLRQFPRCGGYIFDEDVGSIECQSKAMKSASRQ